MRLRNTVLTAAALSVFATQAVAVTIPAGTPISVRLIDSIDSKQTGPGEPFRASIDDPVVVGDRVVIDRGAPCTVQVIEVDKNKELTVKLSSITIRGKEYDVASSYAHLTGRGRSKGKKAARRGVFGGLIGAGIGAIAGGGTGAAIGAATGGGIGAISGAASKGKTLYLPSETRLHFDLRGALPLN